MEDMCLIVTPEIRQLTEKILKKYPSASQRVNLTADRVRTWVESYNKSYDKNPDFVPEVEKLVADAEKKLNMDGKSFLYIPEHIVYTPTGKGQQTYTIIGNKIFNKNGEDVFSTDSTDRNKIFANLAVQNKRAVVVEYRGKKYVVNDRNQIISVTTGDIMKWGEENGDRKAILTLSKAAFEAKQKAETATTNPTISETVYYTKMNSILGEIVKKINDSGLKSAVAARNLYEWTIKANQAIIEAVASGERKEEYIDSQKAQEHLDRLIQKTPKELGDAFLRTLKEISKDFGYQGGKQNTSSMEVIEQLINHLKSIGINVFDKAQMEKYLKENPNTFLQQALEEQQEMQDIKAKAIANGTFMKAPNGKDTNLTERQWLQVRTKNFINWFGDWINDPANASKVVDENGEPLVVYHGTDNTFTVFDPTKQDGEHEAFYFTDSQEMAKSYKGGTVLMPLFLNVRDSYEVNAKGRNWNNIELDLASKAKTPVEFAELILKQQQVEIETAKRGYYDDFWGKFVKDEKYTNEKIKSITERYLPKLYKRYLELQDEHSNNPIKNIKRILEIRSIMKTISNIYKDAYSRNNYGKSQERVSTRDLDLVLNDKEGIIIQNVKDYGSKVEKPLPHNVYVVYQPNQIKSATDNNGMFSIENDNIQMFITPEGEIYGFVTSNGDIYLDETVISPEHPIHEYTHLWDRFVAKRNPRLWKTGVNIMKKTSEWQKVLNDDNYGKKWQKMDMDAVTLDNLVASEVHARLTGKRGSQLLEQIAQEKGGNDIISKLKQWLFDFWKSIKGAFTSWSDAELQKLNNLAEKDIDKALQYLSDMTLRDFTEGVNPSTASLFKGVKETHTALEKDLGGDDNAKAEIKDTVKVAKKGLTFEEAIKGQESFFTKEEQDEIKKGLNGKNLQVMSVSRQTDPAFFSKEIVKFLEVNANKPLSDPTRVNAIEIWSKHDGLPIKDILDACKKYRVAPMVSFSITGLGGTALEGGVMKYQDMLEKVGKLIENGTLNAATTTIRIDPILPGVTNLEDIKKIVATAKSFGIKKFVTSLVQSYGYLEGTPRDRKVISGINSALASENKTYDWDKYYGRDYTGKINFKPKQEYIDEIGKVLLELDKDPEITIQTCSFIIKGLKASACLDPMILERIVGVDVINKDGTYDRDTSRADCMCYGCHSDFFRGQNKKCYSSCAYCYASHSGDNKLNYYNEDGTLKDNVFTQTEHNRVKAGVVQKHHGNWSRQEAQNNPRILYVFTDNTDRDSGSGVIPADSWYSKKYGIGHHFPTMTAAVIRGLDNSRPISTQRWYHPGAKGETGRWVDADIEEFKSVIRDELQEIVNEFNTGKYDTIMFPDGDGLFNTRISNITKTRTPKLYQALGELLYEFGFDSLIPSDITINSNVASEVKGENISSRGSEFAKLLTNPGNNVQVEYKGKTFRNAEHAYQTWKSGEFDEVAYNSTAFKPIGKKAVNKGTSYQTMVDILTAKLQQHPELIEGITQRGGIAYLNASTHNVTGDVFWESTGQNKFLEALKEAYTNTVNNGTSSNATYGMSDAMEAFYHKAVAEKFGTNNSTQTNTQNIVPEANKPKPERPKSVTYESALKLNYSRMAQFSRTFSPQQIKDRGAMIADIFSEKIDLALGDEIDACLDIIESSSASEDEKTQAKQRYNLLRDPLYGRQAIVQEKGVEAIVQEIIQDIETSMDYAKDDKKLLYQNTLDYFTELFNTQATLDIEEREGIRITSLGVAEKTASEEAADEQDDGDDEIGHIVSGSDGWSFQVRYEDPFNSLSKKVRSMLYDIERPDTEKDDLGNTRKYSMGQIYASLLTYLAKNMHSADDFIQIDKSYEGTDHYGSNITEDMYPNGYPTFPVLEQMKNMYPWVNQLIDRLTDDYMSPDWNTDLRYPSTGGAMASQFYTNFRKAFIPYAKIQLGDNKFGVTPLNYEMEDRVQYDKLKANYNNRLILNDHSIYNADGKLNKKNAKWLQQQIKLLLPQLDYYSDFYKLLEEYAEHPEDGLLDEKTIKEHDIFIDKCREVLNSFGIDATTDSVVAYAMIDDKLYEMLQKLEWVTENLLKVEDKDIDSFDYILDTRDKYKTNLWAHFFDGLGMITDGSYMQSFYDSASHKTKYSYSADNYLMKMFRGACMGTLEERRQFIDEHFGKYEWFKNQDTGEWRNKWLEYWYNEPDKQRELPYKNIDNITEYGEDETIIRPYVKWTRDDIWQVQNRSYLPDSKSKFGFFLAPIFSDSPMSMTVKGPKLDMTQLLYGYNDNTGHHQGALVSLVNQELWRIGFTQHRAEEIKKGNIKAISNFDGERGQQFCFLPELNKYTFKNTGETFLERMVSLKNRRATLDEIESSQIEAIEDIIDKKAIEYMEENDKHYESEPIKKDAYYNMVYANAAIIQMATVDLAFYERDVDFQKRFKEVYAGGIELNTNSKYGKKTENVILLTDDTITSPSYDKIAAIIDNSESLSQSDKDYIKSTFTEINVADAQAIRSMHSYRSVLDMMGRWDDRMEKAIQNFENKEWKREDFDIIFQTIKPFVYAVIDRNDGFGGKIPVPQQNKNSEICALMMYDLIVNDLKDSPVYRALSRFMEETTDANGEPLIDMAQYESAGKVGNQGVINISFNPNKVVDIINQGIVIDGKEFTFYPASKDGKFLNNTVENAEKNYKSIKEDIDKDLIEGRMSQKEHNEIIAYLRPTEDEIIDMLSQAALITNPDGSKSINPEVVHTIPFSNYYQQQPTPEHHIDAEATYGSQARNIAVADLPEDLEITLEGKGKNEKTFKGRDAIIDFYYELLNENLIEDFFGKGKKQGLKGIFATKESLRDAITDIVRGNPKYGRDFVEALQIDNNENFVLNPNSPTMFNLTQELITSFFKNRITKQTINGAALIQAAGIGLDDKLRVVFDDNGKVLGAQCLMPLTAKAFFEPLLEEEIINGKKVKVLKPEKLKELGLDKAIGYRIPTENKSSMMPLIITGFTPLQNGSCIVLPAEITNIAGSDFDVDKMFIMLLSFNIITHDKKKALEDYAKQEHEDAQKMIDLLGKANIEDLEIDEIGSNFAEWFKKHEDEYLLKTPIIKKVEYDFGKDFSKSPKDNSRKARNNMLIQLTYKLLTSKEGSESLFNPQGFADVKRAAKITRILTDKNLRKALLNSNGTLGILPPANTIVSEFLSIVQKKYPEQYNDIKQAVSKMTAKQIQQAYLQAITAGQHGDAIQMLLNSSTKDLEKFIEKNSAPESPIFPQTFTHSHARNMAGANQIGIYAIQASMAAKYQRASVKLLEKQQFTVNGRKITNVDVSDNGKRLKNLGQMIGASADNGKDPNLSDMGSTDKTAPIIGYMLRSGLTHLEAALIINQNHMWNANYSSKKYKYWDSILGKNHLSVSVENVTTDMLIKNLISPFELTAEEKKQIAALCYRILTQHEAQEYLTQISRADSPNGSIQNTYAKARIQQYKVDLFQAKMGQKDFPFLRIKEAISNKAIDTAASEGVVREQLKNQRMGFLHGMYALGINSFSNLVSPYFFGARKKFDDVVVKPILYNLNERLSDTKKEEIINNIYTSYITFILSGTPLFGTNSTDSMKQKRDYYLESFPDDYIKIIQENEDIRKLLSSVLQVNSFGSRKRIILQDVGSLSKEQKQSVQFRFESLADSENPVARQLATDLFVYSYFDNGLQFTHDSFSHLFSTRFLINFPVYNEALQKLDEDLDESEYKNFIQQFLVTFNNAAFKVDGIITKDNLDESTDTIKINLNDKKMYNKMVNELMSPKPQFEINVYPYISYNNEIYVLDEDLFSQYPGNPTYHKLPKYATYPRLPLFSREMNITELAAEFPISESTKPSNTNNSSSDAPMAYNESDEDSSIDNSADAAFETMDDFVPDYDPNDIENIPISKSDTYLNEGNDELQKPMCVRMIAKKF